jgi:hypothetical protein
MSIKKFIEKAKETIKPKKSIKAEVKNETVEEENKKETVSENTSSLTRETN